MFVVRYIGAVAGLFLFASSSGTALFGAEIPVSVAVAQETAASQFVRALGDRVIEILKTEVGERRKDKLHEQFTQSFDADAMAKFAAGNYWRRANDRQRQEYLKLFSDYVAGLYANKFGEYAGQSFTVTGERMSSEGDVAVASTIIQGQKPPVKVDFRLRKTEAGFKIIDVYVEGISLLITKRDEFTSVLSREGMDGLIERLRNINKG
jgi:phospholipid transport system substrate-binding protein